jgi:hypothetical protein
MKEAKYKVLWPLGKSVYQPERIAPRLSDLSGKTICELSDWLFKAEDVFPIIRESLAKRYPGIKLIDYTKFGNVHGSTEREVIASLPRLLSEYKCDAIISGVGG